MKIFKIQTLFYSKPPYFDFFNQKSTFIFRKKSQKIFLIREKMKYFGLKKHILYD
jgi:hypothetical protein